ncbi:MAG: chemotaxis protein CheX, partial [Calditrichaeota bacterium]|nr:chemotaxis protein CheX [Calditrichota bacterium]
MNVEIVNPFVNAVYYTFETMAGLSPVRKSPYVKNDSLTQGDVTGVIGFTEKNLKGSIALCFPV